MNLDVKILKKILVKRIKQLNENIIYHDKVVFIPEIQDGSTYANQ